MVRESTSAQVWNVLPFLVVAYGYEEAPPARWSGGRSGGRSGRRSGGWSGEWSGELRADSYPLMFQRLTAGKFSDLRSYRVLSPAQAGQSARHTFAHFAVAGKNLATTDDFSPPLPVLRVRMYRAPHEHRESPSIESPGPRVSKIGALKGRRPHRLKTTRVRHLALGRSHSMHSTARTGFAGKEKGGPPGRSTEGRRILAALGKAPAQWGLLSAYPYSQPGRCGHRWMLSREMKPEPPVGRDEESGHFPRAVPGGDRTARARHPSYSLGPRTTTTDFS